MREGNITTIITRKVLFDKFWITTNSFERGYEGKWSNCLYLHFIKDDFTKIESPPLVDCDWPHRNGKRFAYDESVLANLDWHGGVTFYEETFNPEYGKTQVKIGCDYQHYMDDDYEMHDNGESILKTDGFLIARQFQDLVTKLSKGAQDE